MEKGANRIVVVGAGPVGAVMTLALTKKGIPVTLVEAELFTPAEFDINRPWEHLKQKTLDSEARAKIDRSQFGLQQNQEKR